MNSETFHVRDGPKSIDWSHSFKHTPQKKIMSPQKWPFQKESHPTIIFEVGTKFELLVFGERM